MNVYILPISVCICNDVVVLTKRECKSWIPMVEMDLNLSVEIIEKPLLRRKRPNSHDTL